MIIKTCRHIATVMALLVFGLVTGSVAQSNHALVHPPTQTSNADSGLHDFDFLVGHWQVHHRKLKERLANNHEWVEFEGTLYTQPLMDGYGNVDDTLFNVPGEPYRGVAVRTFDPKTQQWSIWWFDGRTPLGPLGPPVRGTFQNGIGTFYGDDTFNGKPIRVRFIWSKITPNSGRWEQAFSADGGKTWETNWVQDIVRVP